MFWRLLVIFCGILRSTGLNFSAGRITDLPKNTKESTNMKTLNALLAALIVTFLATAPAIANDVHGITHRHGKSTATVAVSVDGKGIVPVHPSPRRWR